MYCFGKTQNSISDVLCWWFFDVYHLEMVVVWGATQVPSFFAVCPPQIMIFVIFMYGDSCSGKIRGRMILFEFSIQLWLDRQVRIEVWFPNNIKGCVVLADELVLGRAIYKISTFFCMIAGFMWPAYILDILPKFHFWHNGTVQQYTYFCGLGELVNVLFRWYIFSCYTIHNGRKHLMCEFVVIILGKFQYGSGVVHRILSFVCFRFCWLIILELFNII